MLAFDAFSQYLSNLGLQRHLLVVGVRIVEDALRKAYVQAGNLPGQDVDTRQVDTEEGKDTRIH